MNVPGYTRISTLAQVDTILARTDGKESYFYVSGSNCPGCVEIYDTIKNWPTTYSTVAFYELDVTSAAHGHDAFYMLGGSTAPCGIIFKNYSTMADPSHLSVATGSSAVLAQTSAISTYA